MYLEELNNKLVNSSEHIAINYWTGVNKKSIVYARNV